MIPQRRLPKISHQRTCAGIDLAAARRLVAGEQVLARAEAAHRRIGAEAPRVDADPAQVLHRIAQVRALPVEHGAQAVGADHDVAVAEVAVDEAELGCDSRRLLLEPAERPFEHRVGIAVGVVELAIVPDQRRRRRLAQRREASRGR